MSVPASAAATALAIPGGGVVGLEDFDPKTDAVTPRLSISHREGVYVNGLTGEKFKDLDVVLLGLVKQRVLWPPTMGDEKDAPLCKSLEFTIGRPGKDFPWDKTGFNQADYANTGEQPELNCADCPLREWGSHPTQNTPWCSEQHTFVLMLPTADEGWTPALFSVQRTGIKPSRTYLSGFKQSNVPLFIVKTKLSLLENKRGMNEYCVPVFARGLPTDESEWQNFADTYRNIRDYLQSPRALDQDEGRSAPSPSPAPAATPAPVPSAGVTAPATSAAPQPADAGAGRLASDDDIPF